jgi:hypothetical protein
MKCASCNRFFDPEDQSPVCPHVVLDSLPPRPGGPKLRTDLQRQIEDAFQLRQKGVLRWWMEDSLNYAARVYAGHLLKRLEETERIENEPSISELQQ